MKSEKKSVGVTCIILQDAMDLFLGNYTIEEGEGSIRQSPLRVDKDWKFLTVTPNQYDKLCRTGALSSFFFKFSFMKMPVIWCIAAAMLSASVLLPTGKYQPTMHHYLKHYHGVRSIFVSVHCSICSCHVS